MTKHDKNLIINNSVIRVINKVDFSRSNLTLTQEMKDSSVYTW